MKASVRFVGGAGSHVSTYMDAPLMERLEVSFQSPTTVVVPVFRPGEIMVGYAPWSKGDPVGDETRRQFGERLRRAARKATREFEEAILASLREQGHLV